MNTVTIRPTLLAVTTPPPEFTAAERKSLETARDKYFAVQCRVHALGTLKAVLSAAGESYAKGECSLEIAIANCSLPNVPDERHRLTKTLSTACKTESRLIFAEVHGIVVKAAAHRHAELIARCQSIETTERQTSESCGFSPDEFTPSPNLESLRGTTIEDGRRLEVLRGKPHATSHELQDVCEAAELSWNEPSRQAVLEGTA